jgi:AraC-like DNA-binding protein
VTIPPAGGYTYVERPPARALAGLVSSAWVQEVAPDNDSCTHRHIPSGAVELLCAVGALPQVVGPLTRTRTEKIAAGTTVVGLRLRPGAAPPILGRPASELVDLAIGVDEIWGASAVALGERIEAARSPQAALHILQAHVAELITDSDAPDPLVSEAVRQLMPWRSNAVGPLASLLNISESQLRRRCRTAVGLSPKTLHRMLRFQGFLALVQRSIAQGKAPTEEEGLALLAAEAGYADQPHLNRECVRLTGVSPGSFIGETAQTCACGHDHAASFAPILRSHPGSRPASAA